MTTTALSKVDNNALTVRQIYDDPDRAYRFAKAMAIGSGGNERDATTALAKMVIGAELGIGAGAAVRGLHFIKQRIAMSADLMVGLAKRDGWKFAVTHSDPPGKSCCVAASKDGESTYTFTWTIQMAKDAGLTGDNWKKYPWDMLYARAASHVARKVAPGILHGMYDPSELSEHVPSDAKPVTVDAVGPAKLTLDDDEPQEPGVEAAQDDDFDVDGVAELMENVE